MKATIQDRPVMKWETLWNSGAGPWRSTPALLASQDFCQAVWDLSGHAADRDMVRFCSSPEARLMPRPFRVDRQAAYYRHPEDTLRMAVILRLRNRYFLPMELLERVIKTLPAQHYELVLADAFSAHDIELLATPEGSAIHAQDVIFRRISRLLSIATLQEEPGSRWLHGRQEFLATLDKFRGWFESNSDAAVSSKPAQVAAI